MFTVGWGLCVVNPGSPFLRFLGPEEGGLEMTSKLFVKHLGYMLGAERENSQTFRAVITMTLSKNMTVIPSFTVWKVETLSQTSWGIIS